MVVAGCMRISLETRLTGSLHEYLDDPSLHVCRNTGFVDLGSARVPWKATGAYCCAHRPLATSKPGTFQVVGIDLGTTFSVVALKATDGVLPADAHARCHLPAMLAIVDV